MIKIELSNEQREKINKLMCGYLINYNISARIEELVKLLQKKIVKKLQVHLLNKLKTTRCSYYVISGYYLK